MNKPLEFLQFKSEFDSLLKLYKEILPKRVLEIGVKHGGTLWYWMKYARVQATIVAVDDCKQWDASNLTKYAHDLSLHFIKGDSHDWKVIESVNSYGPFDFVFIDGDHSYGGVKQDWENYGNAPIVAFHDIVPHHTKEDQNGAAKLWQELREKYSTLEFVEDWSQSANGIGVVLTNSADVL